MPVPEAERKEDFPQSKEKDAQTLARGAEGDF